MACKFIVSLPSKVRNLIDRMSEIKERIEQLRSELEEHNYRYYVESSPSLSDKEFDQMLCELQAL